MEASTSCPPTQQNKCQIYSYQMIYYTQLDSKIYTIARNMSYENVI